MNSIAKIVSLIALVATVGPSLLFFLGFLDIQLMKWIALGGTVAWFVATPMWLGREQAA